MIKKIFSGILILVGLFMALAVNAVQTTVSTSPHWKNGNITVYIPPKEQKTDTMKHAFQRWQRMSFGKLNFTFVEKEPAQITVQFSDKVSGADGPIGVCSLVTEGMYIKQANITIATKSKEKYSDDMIFTTMLHEVGHALGLNDSTRKYRSIMHFPVTEDQDILSIDMEKLFKINNWSWAQRNLEP